MLLSKAVRIDGLRVHALGDSAQELDRMAAAIGLIRTYDETRYRRLLRDLQAIWLSVLPGALGQYRRDRAICLLDEAFVRSASIEAIASVIIHEATHARLIRFGYSEGQRGRIERICTDKQVAFARKHPDNEAILDWLARFRGVPEAFWSNASMRARREAGEYDKARELGVPLWLISAVHRLRRFGFLPGA